jgi:biopolymer transport protein ExbD
VPELLVEIQRGGTEAAPAPRILIDRIPMRSLEAARDYLRRYAQFPRATEAHVIVAPADDAIHDWVMKVLDILKQLGYEKFSFRQ